MSYCECALCNADEPVRPKATKLHYVVVRKEPGGFWSTRVGAEWVGLRGTDGLTLQEVRDKVFSHEDSVSAHPNSVHFDEEVARMRR